MEIGLMHGEKIILTIRRHWFVLAYKVVSLFVLAIMPLVLFAFLSNTNVVVDFGGDGLWLGVFLYVLWMLGLWIIFFMQWTDYYYDLWYVTNKRVIDVDQKGFFHIDIATCFVENIQDMRVETAGFIPTLLDMGDIYLQTSGTRDEFSIEGAAHPEKIKAILIEQMELIKK